MGILTVVPFTTVLPLLEPDTYQDSLALFVSALVGIVLSQILLHRGWVDFAAATMCALAWFVTLWASFATGGLASPQLSMGVLAIMLAGILLSGWGAFAMALGIAVSLIGLEFLRGVGWLPQPYIAANPITVWISLSTVLIVSAVLLNLYLNAMRVAREDAARTATLLAEEMERRLATEAAMQRSQKLEALGRLSGGIAHDFNNILTVLQGESELLQMSAASGKVLDGKQMEQLEQIIRGTERAAALTRQLLAFSRQQPGVPEHLSVDKALRRIHSMLERLIRADVSLEINANAAEAPVNMDVSQLDQIVMNLALNASDAMPDGGRLRIETRVTSLDNSDVAYTPEAQLGEYVCIEVSDTGEGIPPDHLELIFDPFFTTKGIGQGTGLGLASTHGIVTASGGFIDVRSEVGIGTSVRVFLPKVEPVPEVTVAAANAQQKTTRRKVLLCEDDSEVRSITSNFLEIAGHRVTAVESAEAALECLSVSNTDFDLLLTDVILPGSNGVTLAREARHRHPQLDVLLMSGYTADVLENSGVPDDIELLQKPFRRELLIERINALAV
ncbi:MAG: ATP-binding protein [Pseudomonadota bacterium]